MATAKTSAGLLPYRVVGEDQLEVLIAHMGGPYWASKDAHAWSIFKGEFDPGTDDAPGEDPLDAAKREFAEETGQPAPGGKLVELGEIKQSSGKRVIAWAVEAPDLDPSTFESNTFTVEWPPRSGKQREFPEIDRAEWLPIKDAWEKLVKGQVGLLERLAEALVD